MYEADPFRPDRCCYNRKPVPHALPYLPLHTCPKPQGGNEYTAVLEVRHDVRHIACNPHIARIQLHEFL